MTGEHTSLFRIPRHSARQYFVAVWAVPKVGAEAYGVSVALVVLAVVEVRTVVQAVI